MSNISVSSTSGSYAAKYEINQVENTMQETSHLYAAGDNIFSYAYEIMLKLQDLQASRAFSQFESIQKASSRAKDTQEMANRVDEAIAKAAKGDDKTTEKLPDGVEDYMKNNGITVDGMTITEYINKNSKDGGLDKGSLQAIKAALDNSSSRDSDLSTQGQLTIQKATQMLNAVITQATGLVSKWGDILQMISQKTFS